MEASFTAGSVLRPCHFHVRLYGGDTGGGNRRRTTWRNNRRNVARGDASHADRRTGGQADRRTRLGSCWLRRTAGRFRLRRRYRHQQLQFRKRMPRRYEFVERPVQGKRLPQQDLGRCRAGIKQRKVLCANWTGTPALLWLALLIRREDELVLAVRTGVDQLELRYIENLSAFPYTGRSVVVG